MVSFRSFVLAVSMLPTMATAMYNYVVETEEIGGSTVTGKVILTIPEDFNDAVCWSGTAEGLTKSLFTGFSGGEDCGFENGCGTHIHEGTSCVSSALQGGHLYNPDEQDPWTFLGYPYTDGDGKAQFSGCARVGIDLNGGAELEGRPFIIHANDGSRASCGLITKKSKSSKKSKKGRNF